MMQRPSALVLALAALTAVAAAGCATRPPAWREVPADPAEPHLSNLRKLTFGGENAEAYWSWDAEKFVFQMRGRHDYECDQILTMAADGNDERLVSVMGGRTTCAYWMPGDERIVFASTHLLGPECPKEPEKPPRVYAWPLLDYDVFTARPDGSDIVRLTDTPGYDAEATVAPDGTIVFTSVRDGDLDIYTMRPDGSDVRRLTDAVGYDGGPFFTWDGKKIVYRCHHPTDPAEIGKYKDLLGRGLVTPSKMDIWIMDADGSNKRQVTKFGKASFAPYLHPDGRHLLFSSNWEDPKGREFDIYVIDLEDGKVERVTRTPGFDGFPMFSPDGRTLVFCSNRLGEKQGDTNVFLADWVE
jgi:Tol biopolymer transport system component